MTDSFLLTRIKKPHNIRKLSIVPIYPKRTLYPKFYIKYFFLRLYPSANIMGGTKKYKNEKLFSKSKFVWNPYFKIADNPIPSSIAIPLSLINLNLYRAHAEAIIAYKVKAVKNKAKNVPA